MKPKKSNKKDFTTIWLHKNTVARIDNHGLYGDTYDILINRLIDKVELSQTAGKNYASATTAERLTA